MKIHCCTQLFSHSVDLNRAMDRKVVSLVRILLNETSVLVGSNICVRVSSATQLKHKGVI